MAAEVEDHWFVLENGGEGANRGHGADEFSFCFEGFEDVDDVVHVSLETDVPEERLQDGAVGAVFEDD